METVNLDVVISRFAAFAFDDRTSLAAAGIESLTILRLAVEVAAADDAEIDASGLAGLRTVGDLKQWLGALVAEPAGGSGPGPA
jgi:acyl carrier protein